MKKIRRIGLLIFLVMALTVITGVTVRDVVTVPVEAAVSTKKMSDGIHKIDGKYYYYLNNKKQTGLKTVKAGDGTEKLYLFGEDGAALKGFREYNGKQYYFRADGTAFTGGYLKFTCNGKTYYRYFMKSGKAFTGGFKTVYGCYTAKNGVVTAPAKKTALRLYFQPDGRKYTGGLLTFPDADGKKQTYYFKSNGGAFTGGYKKASGGAVVKKAGTVPVAVKDNTAYIYYFQPNGRAFKNGVLCYEDEDGRSNIYRFDADGHASGKGYITTDIFYKVNKSGKPVAQKKQTYRFYIQNSKRGFYSGYLRFVHTDGKTYRMYFKKDGTALTSASKAVHTRYDADKNGFIRDITDKYTYAYSFSSSGKGTLSRDKWVKSDGVWSYFNDNGVRKYISDAMHSAWYRIKDQSSRTGYYIVVDTDACRTFIFKGKAGAWKPFRNWQCSPGKPSTPTVKGHYTITAKEYFFNTEHNTCYYASQFYGDYLFHSTLYWRGTWDTYDDRLGMQLSHGCVRLKTENAKWFYENIPVGSAVYIY